MTEPASQDAPRGTLPPLAIIGIGCLFPGAHDASTYWANIRAGVDAIGEVPPSHWSADDYFDPDPAAPDHTYARRGAFLEPYPFRPLDYGISPLAVEATDTTQLLGLVVAEQALRDAGYAPRPGAGAGRPLDRRRASVILGVTGALELVIPLGARLGHPRWRKALAEAGVAPATADDVVRRIAESYVPWQEQSFPGLLGNVAAGRIAQRFDLEGTNCVVDAACASSLAAIHLAALELHAGRADVVISGGLDTFSDIFMYLCFSKTPALSPTGDSRPLSAGADGTILGEGLGVVVLKRWADAQRDGDRVYALIRGIGTSSDGSGTAIYAPNAEGQRRALRAAYQQSGCGPETIELVEAHGTGTRVGDAVELEALGGVFREAQPHGTWCAVGSVKSMIGHTKAAAGVAGLIKAVLALENKTLPPTIKVEQPSAALATGDGPLYVNTQPRPWLARREHPRRAGVSAFGFGGSNYHCVLEEASPLKVAADWDARVLVFPLSAQTPAALDAALVELGSPPESEGGAEVSWTARRAISARLRAAFDAGAPYRAVLVAAQDGTPLGELVDTARRRAMREAASQGNGTILAVAAPLDGAVDGIYLGSGPRAGRLAALFPGQGSQRVGMLRELACQFPQWLARLAAADETFGATEHGARLSDHVYPPSAFDDATRRAQAERLAQTEVAQPALAAVELGAWHVLESLGVAVEAAAGHSFGELVALAAAGVLAPDDLDRLANLRGRAMYEAASQGDGTMLAVAAPLEDVGALLKEHRIEATVANHNAPRQVVLSLDRGAVGAAVEAFRAKRIATRQLDVSAAFHSPQVAAAAEPLAAALRSTEIGQARFPVYANTTADRYPDEPDAVRGLLAGQLAQRVSFAAQIERMYADGVRAFIEVGPGRVLSGLVAAILADRPHRSISIDASVGRRGGIHDLAAALAELAAAGYSVDWTAWDAGFEPTVEESATRRPTLSIPLTGANYVRPRAPQPASTSTPAPVPPPAPAVSPTPAALIGLAAPSGPAGLSGPVASSAPAALSGLAAPSAPAAPSAIVAANVTSGAVPPLAAAAQNVPRPQVPATHPPSMPMSDPAIRANDEAHHTAAARATAPALVEALRTTHESLLALERMQQQTAALHQQYLDGQHAAQQAIGALVVGQQQLLQAALAGRPLLAAAPATVSAASGMSTSALTMPPTSSAMATSASATPPSAAAAVPTNALTSTAAPTSSAGIAPLAAPPLAAPPTAAPPMAAPPMAAPPLAAPPTAAPPMYVPMQPVDAVPTTVQTSPGHAPDRASTVELPLGNTAGETAAERLAARLLAIVADKTGYPVEMLDWGMSLDGDLGIDSIKRVEILSAIQEDLPELPSLAAEQLAAAATLQAIRDLMLPGVASLPGPSQPPSSAHATREAVPPWQPSADQQQPDAADETTALLLAVVSDKTGYPVEMLDLEMTLDTDLGIDSIKRVEILSALQEARPDLPTFDADELGRLVTLGEIVARLGRVCVGARGDNEAAGAAASSAASHDDKPAATLEPHALVFAPLSTLAERAAVRLAPAAHCWISDDGTALPGALAAALAGRGLAAQVVSPVAPPVLDPSLAALVLLAPPRAAADDVRQALALIQHAAPALRRTAETTGAVLACISRLGGRYGLDGEIAEHNTLTGAWAGLVKTASREWPAIEAKSLDIADDDDDFAALAAAVADELLLAGPLEIGLAGRHRYQLELVAEPRSEAPRAAVAPPWAPGDLVVVSGGARGVTAEVAVAIARALGPRLLILGRTPLVADDPPWAEGLTDPAALKRALLAQHGGQLTPRALETQYAELTHQRAMRTQLARIGEALAARGVGRATVEYRAVDIRDRAAVEAVLSAARAEFGPVRGIVHGAGVLADRRIEEKSLAEFDRVWQTKVGGLTNLLAATRDDSLAALVLFSSSTARYGRAGQADYAAANEVLNKRAQFEARRRPDCRVVSFNWGPWDGGMVTPALKRLFATEGIGLIPLDAGASLVVDRLQRPPGGPVEVVVLAGAAPQPASTAAAAAKATATAGIAPAAADSDTPHRHDPAAASTAAVADRLSPDQVLHDVSPAADARVRVQRDGPLHQGALASTTPALELAFERVLDIDRFPVLRSHVLKGRAVLPTVLMIEWFAHGALHDNLGLRFHGFDELQIFKGVTLSPREQVTLRVLAGPASVEGRFERVNMELRDGTTLHARASVLLAHELPVALASSEPLPPGDDSFELAPWYAGGRLFHGPDMQGLEAIEQIGPEGLVARVRTSPPPAAWLERPLRAAWLSDPLALDAAFQAMVLWCRAYRGAASLPTGIVSYRQYCRRFPGGTVKATVRVVRTGRQAAEATIELLSADGALLARLNGYQCVIDPSLDEAFAQNQLLEPLEA